MVNTFNIFYFFLPFDSGAYSVRYALFQISNLVLEEMIVTLSDHLLRVDLELTCYKIV